MRQLPYAKQLVEARRAGNRPWLVVLSVGGDSAWRATYRRLVAPGDPNVARLWWPDDVTVEEVDLACLLGADVLVVDCTPINIKVTEVLRQRVMDVLLEIWKRGTPATLWVMRQPDRKWMHLSAKWAKFRAAQLYEPAVGVPRSPLLMDGIGHPIDEGLREHIASARDAALLIGDKPLFHLPQFAQVRGNRLRELDDACRLHRAAA